VKSRRRAALSEDPDLFSGAFWSGSKAVALGLADSVGELRAVLRDRYGANVRLKTIATERSMLRRRLGGLDGGRLVDGAIAAIEERLLWNRFGL
jgi:serine protease SohB